MVGILWILYDLIYYRGPRSKVETGFKGYYAENKHRFEDNDFQNRSHISEYSLQSMPGDEDYKNQIYRPPNLNDDGRAF